jgi:DNA anti-recombination protein RmuC
MKDANNQSDPELAAIELVSKRDLADRAELSAELLRKRAEELAADLEQLRRRCSQLEEQHAVLSGQNRQLRNIAQELNRRFEAVCSSSSWRLTAPLRKLMERVRTIAGRTQPSEQSGARPNDAISALLDSTSPTTASAQAMPRSAQAVYAHLNDLLKSKARPN